MNDTPPRERHRLYRAEDFLPWVRADRMEHCFLYWLPVEEFPLTHDRKQWVTAFLERFGAALNKQAGPLRCEVFLEYKGIGSEHLDDFLRYSRQCMTMLGMVRRPGASVPVPPSPEEIDEIARSRETVDFQQWVADYCYWFVMKQPERQRELFLGLGAMTTLWMEPDPATKAPPLRVSPALRKAHPVFQMVDVDARYEASFAVRDRFLAQSKQLFGAGLTDLPAYPGLAFILPVPDSEHFFALDEETCASWFDLFQVYCHESKTDKGILLAFRKDYEDMLLLVLRSMRSDDLHYPASER